MTDVTALLGLHGSGRISFYAACPCCDGEKGRHLNINLKKEVFRCARCGEAGGIFDLYALFTGTPREQARRALIDRIGLPQRATTWERQVLPQENRIAPVETRHKAYSELLSVLTLAGHHRENLQNRGLTEDAISRLGYKSIPVGSGVALAQRIRKQGALLEGVPGFFRTKEGEWSFVHQQAGILIPVRDTQGLIQGLQVRLDDTGRGKFR